MAVNIERGPGAAGLDDEREANRGSNRGFIILVNVIVLVIAILVLFPFYEVVIVSFGNNPGNLIPTHFNLGDYKYIIGQSGALRAFFTSVGIVLVGTTFSLLLTILTAYPLSKKQLPGRGIFTGIMLFTMFFGGGLVPWYLVLKQMHLLNSYGVYIVPSAINTFYVILMMSFFREFPESLEESALIDGAGDWTILTKIVLPTSMPVIATISLFYSVDRWNDWFTPILTINDTTRWSLQAFTYNLLQNVNQFTSNAQASEAASIAQSHIQILPDGLKMAVIIVGMIPIMCVYPFLQKYFAKGVMLGSVKG